MHLAILLATLGIASATAETPRPTLIVIDLQAERGLDEGTVRLLNELLLTQFTRAGTYEVTGGSDLRAVLDLEQQKQLVGCTDASCFIDIGGALGAEYVAVSNIGRIGDYFLVNVKIIEVKSGRVINRWSAQVQGIENQLMSAIRESVDKVVASPAGRAPEPGAGADVGAATDEADTTEVALAESEVEPEVTAPPVTATSGPAIGIPTWVSGGVAVAAAAAGTALGLMARSDLSVSPVDPGYAAAEDAARGKALGATVAFGVAGAAATAAVVLLVLDLTGSEDAAPVSAGASGLVVHF